MTFQNWSVSFDYDAQNRLISKSLTNTAPASSGIVTNVETKWQFFYNTSSGLLERIMDPRGNTNIFVAYDQYERKTNQVDALGRVTKTEYNAPAKRQVRHTDPEGTRQGGDPAKHQWLETYDRKGRVLVQRDPLGNETRHTYDERGNRTSLRDPLGNTTFYAYDSRANVTAETNALGEVRLWEYHSFFNKPVRQITPHPLDVNGRPFWTNYFGISDQTGNLTNHWDDLGPLVRYTYRTNGLVETATDANGNVTRFDYDDTNGFLRARIDPAGHTNLFLNNDVGWKLAEINALRQVTRFSYDLNGNVVRTLDPLHRTFTRTYDANGNLLSASDAKGQLTTYAYDAANQRTNMVDRTRTNTWSYTYTPRGEVATIRDPLLNTSTNFHDAANRLIRVESPLNLTHRFEYDPNGNRTNRIDQLGRSWKTRYDRLNRVIAESDPLGNTRQTTYDVAGRIQTITTPNGHPSLHFYDGRGRLKLWQDAEGFPWRYLYDGVGNIVNIIDALNGNYSMAYSNRNERILEKNQDGFEWTYRYDPLLRLEFQRDPNGTTRALKYDAGGRIESVTFNTGRVNAFLYDDNNNPEVLSRSGSGPPTLSQLRYDAMDRVTEYTDAFGKRVQYGYDALGRATSVTYPGGKVLAQSFDALGRLTNQVFNSQFTNTYAYDKASRLIRRAYPNGVTQTNVFDDAGRITDLSYLTNSPTATNALMALTYAYDRNGNKTAATEKGTLDWPMPTLMDETSGFTLAGRLTNRVDALNPTNSFTYKYDASGNMTNSAGGGQDWCLTYDEDNRVMSVDWDCGMTEKRIANRYDAFGRRVSRTVDGTETRFVLDLSGTMERILCDADGSGAITAWYVHGPDLAFKVDSTNGLTCYHADAMANIIALTGTGGTNTAQYAYTPYGRSLGSTNLQSQIANPYQFVGSHGVMEELPGLYFMRARYYSADAGVFLSTDPLKKIGPGWKPVAYHYADGNPVSKADPQGEVASYVAAFGSGFAFGAKKALIDETIQRSLEEFAIAAGIPQEHVGFVSGGYDFVMMTLVDIPVSAALITADFYGAAGHGTATVAGYWAGKELSKKGVNEGFDFLKGNGSRYITWGQQSFLNDSGSTGAKQRISPSNSSSSSSLLAEKHPDAAAYAESQNVNYSTSSKAIREIYDRGQTARNNLIDSLSQGKRANESQSAYMDRLVNKLKSDLSTTPKNKAPQPKKKK
ncbi:MAG TPA: RHS repeat-associated core domain-containing protein [Methylomirabilota bacterium]|nr:RHS repeat-associated core domain-containing protein [Methylomirabilota bacterium]